MKVRKLSRFLIFLLLFSVMVNVSVAAENNTSSVKGSGQWPNLSNPLNSISDNNTTTVNQTVAERRFNSSSLEWEGINQNGAVVQTGAITNNTSVTKSNNFGYSKYNLFDKGSMMVADGFTLFLIRMADEMVTMGFESDEEELKIRDNYGEVVSIIYKMATAEFHPENIPFIRDLQLRCNIIGILIILCYIFLGASSVNLLNFKSSNSAQIASKVRSKFGIQLSDYRATVMEMCLMQMFGYFFLWFSIEVETMFCKLIMLNVLDKIAPTGENVIMYLMMAICYLVMALVLAYRLLIIALFHCGYLIVIGMYCFPMSRDAAKAALYYYLKILFMRTAIVGITVVGIGVTTSLNTADLGLAALGLLYVWPLMYTALIIILIAYGLITIFQIKNVFGATKKLVRHYI